VLATMVIDVGVIDKRWHQEWYATEQIPNKPKQLEPASGTLMHHLMNEHRGAVKQQTGREEEERLLEAALKALVALVDRATIYLSETIRTGRVGDQEVGPVDPNSRSKEIADQMTASAKREFSLACRGL
jgi:hypothetical protein